MKCGKPVVILFMFCVIMAMLIEETESKRRRLCKFKKAKNKCVDIIHRKDRLKRRQLRKLYQMNKNMNTCKTLFLKKRRHRKQKPGRCEKQGGTCEIFQGRKQVRCICSTHHDV